MSAGHDPFVCGLDDGGQKSLCSGCRVEANRDFVPVDARAPDALRSDINRLAEMFEEGDRRLKRAETIDDVAEAAAQRFAAKELFHAGGEWLADFGLLCLRYALYHRREALLLYLRDALRDDFAELAALLAKPGGRRK